MQLLALLGLLQTEMTDFPTLSLLQKVKCCLKKVTLTCRASPYRPILEVPRQGFFLPIEFDLKSVRTPLSHSSGTLPEINLSRNVLNVVENAARSIERCKCCEKCFSSGDVTLDQKMALLTKQHDLSCNLSRRTAEKFARQAAKENAQYNRSFNSA